MKTVRRTGAIGALLEVYEKVLSDLKQTIAAVSAADLVFVFDRETIAPECRSVQSILTHVVSSGYSYATYIHNLKASVFGRPEEVIHTAVENYVDDLNEVLNFTTKIFEDFQDTELEQFDDTLKIHTGWGQVYDVEQLMEHAIVHVLRHHRQISNALSKIKAASSIL